MGNYKFNTTFSNPFDLIFDELLVSSKPTMRYTQPKAKQFSENLALAGLRKEDLIIEVKDKVLTVKTKSSNYTGYLARYNDYVYRCVLMDDHDEKNIEAAMTYGLLTITIPLKKEKEKNSVMVEIK